MNGPHQSPQKETFINPHAAAKEVKALTQGYNRKTGTIILSAVAVVLLAAIGIVTMTMLKSKQPQDEFVYNNEFDVNDTGAFVTETDSLNISALSGNVIGTGVLYENADIYAEASADSSVVASLESGTTLLVYQAEGDYYQISNADNTVSGYVLKKLLNTGGLDLGNPNAPEQVMNENTGKTTASKQDTKKTVVSSDEFPVNASPYFIYVEKGSHTITIFAKDDEGHYTQAVRTYLTATGRTAALTPVGDFSILGKEKWHSWGKSYSPYCSKYYGGLFFHGPLYREKNFGTLYESSVSAIGTNASSGCMRTSVNAAYFIYAFCPVGTNVRIVNGSPLNRFAEKPTINSQYIDPATNRVPVAGINFSFDNKTIQKGDKITVTVNFTPAMASEKGCVWNSGVKGIAKLNPNENSCTITGLAAGHTVITATSVDGSYQASFTLTVMEEPSSEETSATSETTETTESAASDTTTASETTTTTTSEATSSPTTEATQSQGE